MVWLWELRVSKGLGPGVSRMSRSLRLGQSGASVCFTVALTNRSKRTLVGQIGPLRDAVGATMRERRFRIDVWVVLPDHRHAIWTLPEGDAGCSTRWRQIKTRFSCGLPVGPQRHSHVARQERGICAIAAMSRRICSIAGAIR